MELSKVKNSELLDAEWAALINEARKSGMSINDIRSALAELQAMSNSVWMVKEAAV